MNRFLDRSDKQDKRIPVCFIGSIYYLLVIVRAATICMTWDEGFTYVHYVRHIIDDPSDFFRAYTHCVANNHLLNSISILITDLIFRSPYNEFLVRIPALCACAFFLFVLSRSYLREEIDTFVYIMFISNGLLSEYGFLARGYGISCTMILIACLEYKRLEKADDAKDQFACLVYISIFAVIAEAGNTIAFLTVFPIYILTLLCLVRKKTLREMIRGLRLIILAAIGMCHLVLMIFHYSISIHNKPLYVGRDGIFRSFFGGYGMTYGSFITEYIFMFLIPISFILYAAFRIKNKDIFSSPFVLGFIVHFVTVFISCYLTGKGLPTGRTLIPSMPVLFLALDEIFRALNASVRRYILPCIAILFAVLFVTGLSFSQIRDYPVNSNDKRFVYELMRDNRTLEDAGVENMEQYTFYIGQLKYYYGYELTKEDMLSW